MAMIEGRVSAVPQPKPHYCPPGHHRCASCNALVRDGERCRCEEEPRPVVGELFVNGKNMGRVKAQTYEPQFNKMAMRCGCGATFIPGLGRYGSRYCPDCREAKKEETRRKREEKRLYNATKTRTMTCETCGSEFVASCMGRTPRFCPKCREDRSAARRRDYRERTAKARRLANGQ